MKTLIVGGKSGGGRVDPALRRAYDEIGRDLAKSGHDLIICSPYAASADSNVAQAYLRESGRSVTMFIPNESQILRKAQKLVSLGAEIVVLPARPRSVETSKSALSHYWAYAHTDALDACEAVVAIGGRIEGAGRAVLQRATYTTHERPVVPFAAFGGAAKDFFEEHFVLLQARLGPRVDDLRKESAPSKCGSLLAAITRQTLPGNPVFFLSYSHAQGRINDGDTVANILQDQIVWRDLRDLGVDHNVDEEIRQAISRAHVFVAVWSYDYAASPNCIEELEMALDRRDKRENSGLPQIWILRMDEAKISNRRLRKLLGSSGSNPNTMEKRSDIVAFLRRGIEGLAERR